MNDTFGRSATEDWDNPDTSSRSNEDGIGAFIRSSLQAGHPPGKIAMTLEQHSPGLGRAYLAPIQALARQIGGARGPDVPKAPLLNGPFGGEMPGAPSAPSGGWFPGRGRVVGQQAPTALSTGQGIPHFGGTRNASLAEFGLPARSAALGTKKAAPAGLLQPLSAVARPVRSVHPSTPSTPSSPPAATRKRRYHYPIDDLSVEPTANPTADPYQHPGYLGFIGSTAESGGGKHLISDGSKDPRGGTSYGRNQLSSKTSTMKEFLTEKDYGFGLKFAKEFKNTEPGTKEFDDIYRELTKTRGAELEEAEHNFLYATRYLPVAKEAEEHGFNLRNRAVQEAIWSMAVQRGPTGGIDMITEIVAAGVPRDSQSMIDRLYEARIKHAPSQWERFSAEWDKVKEFDRKLREASISRSPLHRHR